MWLKHKQPSYSSGKGFGLVEDQLPGSICSVFDEKQDQSAGDIKDLHLRPWRAPDTLTDLDGPNGLD